MTSIFAQLGTQWGAIYSQKVSGGQKIKEGAWLVPEIGFKRYGFLTIAGGTKLGIRTLPDSSKKKVGVTPPHLAGERGRRPAVFGIRRRRACLGMPTDCERRNTMWRCTNDRERGCRKLMGLITVEKEIQKR